MSFKQVAFIRGINVGRAKRVAMADLRRIVEDLGYSDVRTLLNSGNIIFTASDKETLNSAACIEEALSTRLGISAKVTVLNAEELVAIVNENPLAEITNDSSRLLVAILGNPMDRTQLIPLEEEEWTPEVFAMGARAAYLWCPDGILVSRLVKTVNYILGNAVTTRNWATMLKIHALIKGD